MKKRAMNALHKVRGDMGLPVPAIEPSVADYATTYGGTIYMSPPQSILSASTEGWFTTGTVTPSTYAAASPGYTTVEPSVHTGSP